MFSPWLSRQIPQCWWAIQGRSRPAQTGGGSLSPWSCLREGSWQCWSGEIATAWGKTRCSWWSPPCSLSWSCHDGGMKWSVVFWEETRWLERCCLQTQSGSRYLHVRDNKDRRRFETLEFDFHRASWLSNCVTPSTRCLNMRSNSVTYCSSASRWWLWLALLWICCGGAVWWSDCCRWRADPLWPVGIVQRRGLGLTDSPPAPAVMVVPPLAKWRGLESCSQPCWQLNEVSVSGPVLCVHFALLHLGTREGF